MKKKILYAITTEDVMTIVGGNKVLLNEQDLLFLADRIGDFFGGHWQYAVEYALEELGRKQSSWR